MAPICLNRSLSLRNKLCLVCNTMSHPLSLSFSLFPNISFLLPMTSLKNAAFGSDFSYLEILVHEIVVGTLEAMPDLKCYNWYAIFKLPFFKDNLHKQAIKGGNIRISKYKDRGQQCNFYFLVMGKTKTAGTRWPWNILLMPSMTFYYIG